MDVETAAPAEYPAELAPSTLFRNGKSIKTVPPVPAALLASQDPTEIAAWIADAQKISAEALAATRPYASAPESEKMPARTEIIEHYKTQWTVEEMKAVLRNYTLACETVPLAPFFYQSSAQYIMANTQTPGCFKSAEAHATFHLVNFTWWVYAFGVLHNCDVSEYTANGCCKTKPTDSANYIKGSAGCRVM